MPKLNKIYSEFLNALDIEWCLIKDTNYLLKTGYDNEIDILVNKKDRKTIRALGRKQGWYESTLNNFNTHVILWKYEGGVFYRIDAHVGQTLATAVPWFKSKEILPSRIKVKDLWSCSPEWELVIILLSSLRGRAPKKHRVARAKELKDYLPKTKVLLRKYLSEEKVDHYYSELTKGNKFKLSKKKRLGFCGIMKQHWLNLLLFVTRLSNPSPVFNVNSENLAKELVTYLGTGKIHAKYAKKPKLKHKIFSDVVISVNVKEDKSEVKKIVAKIYPTKSSL